MQVAESPTIPIEAQANNQTKISIWLALLAALLLHIVVLFAPLSMHISKQADTPALIELQLTSFEPPPGKLEAVDAEPIEKPIPEPEPILEKTPPRLESPVVKVAENVDEPQTAVSAVSPKQRNFDQMNPSEKTQLTSTLLSRQFISEPSAADQVFGKPLPLTQPSPQAEFHYPIQPNMLSMLDKPMQDLPFEFKEGLVHFAYDPGVKGDLQRFWDVITPEFGWFTRHGTEVRCKLILVIAGCAWK
jgi:hypothetical protein